MNTITWICLIFWVQILAVYCHQFSVTYDPPVIRGLHQWKSQNVSFVISAEDLNLNTTSDGDGEYELVLSHFQYSQYHRQVLEFVGDNVYHFRVTASEPTFSSQFQIKALFLGYSNITFNIYKNNTLVQVLDHYSISVVRTQSIYDALFGVLIISLVSINYINMGCHLDLQIVKKTLKTPIGPLIGFVCQFTIMPLASYLIGWLLLDDISLRLGLFTLGCSPGGNSSNFWTLLFNGDVNLSITMTLISTVASLAMMPLWLFTLGSTLFSAGNIKIPYLNLFTSLITLTFPMFIGILIRHYRPNWAKVSHKIIKPFTIVVVIFGIAGSAILYNHIFVMFTWPIVIAGALVAISGYSLGAIISSLCGMKRPQVVAISIETAYQNGGIAFILLLLSLQQPDADIASVPCIAQLLITGQPLWLVLIGVKIWNRFHPQNNDKSVDNKNDKISEQTDKNVNNLENGCYDGPYIDKPKTDTELNASTNGTHDITKF